MILRHPMAIWVGPPDSNWGGNRPLSSIDYVVVHRTVGTVDMALNRFRTDGQQASSTYILGHPLGRYGLTLFQVCERDWVPWTNSTYIDPGGNPHSITFEVEDLGRYYDPAPEEQLRVLAQAIRWECEQDDVPMTRAEILGHRECDGGIATACPAAMFPQLEHLVDLVNSQETSMVLDPNDPVVQQIQSGIGEVWNTLNWGTPVGGAVPQGWMPNQLQALQEKIQQLQQPAVNASAVAAALAADPDFLAAIAKAVNDEAHRRSES